MVDEAQEPVTIFARYVARRFLGPFLFGWGTFAALAFLGDLFDKINRLAASPAPAPVVLQYLLLQFPYWAVRVMPLATLLAALFAVSGFVRSGEFIGVQAAGLEARRFFRPLLWLSLAVAAAGFAAQETLLPACFGRSQHLWREKVYPRWEWDLFQDVALSVDADRLLTASMFRVKDGTLERPVLDEYRDGRLARQLDALRGRWDPETGRWVFFEGVERRFGPEGRPAGQSAFERIETSLALSPRELRPDRKKPDEMSFLELRELIGRLEGLGQPAHRERTGLHSKLATPFTNVVLCALGIPIALRLRRAGKPLAFSAALVVGFLYIWVMELGRHMGDSGRMPPLYAAWIANVLFGALAVWLHKRADI